MIIIKNVTMKNFLSIGNVTQAVNLENSNLVLILGENLDQGGGGSRNGVGKTTIIQAICFGLYGIPLTNIKKDNLVNKTNQKSMAVSIEFTDGKKTYRIERGRKPNFLKFSVDDSLVNAPDTDEAHGESKWTQHEIEKVLGLSHNLFRHIMALHTKTTPFLSLGANAQREIIEELFGISLLSQKAEVLKTMLKDIKDEIKSEETKIKTLDDSNKRIQKNIDDLRFKGKMWDREHDKKVNTLQEAITQLEHVDIENEIEAHGVASKIQEITSLVDRYGADALDLDTRLERITNNISLYESQLMSAHAHNCPLCGSKVHDDKHEKIVSDLQNTIKTLNSEYQEITGKIVDVTSKLEDAIQQASQLGDMPEMFYSTVQEAYEHKQQLMALRIEFERDTKMENPYVEQIANLSESGLVDISYEYLNAMISMKEHQEFLLKILTNKDSFIRKKIIDQNLQLLNKRLNYYLEKLQLPHEVVFQSDLSVEITQLGRDFDFEQLSNGEANRLVLALAWSFRDVWESTNQPINLLMIDELVDSGMDGQGMDSALEILKKMSRDRNKKIMLISHKDELVSRVEQVLLVQKENGFSTIFEESST